MVKDLPQKRIWIDVDLEEEGADALDPAFEIDWSVDINELVRTITPLPEVLQQNQLVKHELVLLNRDRVVLEGKSET